MGSKKNRRTPSITTSISKRKRKNPARKSKLSHFTNETIKKHWDESLTQKENYAKLGLVAIVNDVKPRMKVVEEVKEVEKVKASGVIKAELEEVEELSKKVINRQVKSMPLSEQKILISLTQKYGNDLNAMEKDITLNVYQKTKAQLQKRFEVLAQLQAL